MTIQTTILLSLTVPVLSWLIFYYVVKAAVKNGIREALARETTSGYDDNRNPERMTSPRQVKLQQQYDRGEISFEVYQSEWGKLSS